VAAYLDKTFADVRLAGQPKFNVFRAHFESLYHNFHFTTERLVSPYRAVDERENKQNKCIASPLCLEDNIHKRYSKRGNKLDTKTMKLPT